MEAIPMMDNRTDQRMSAIVNIGIRLAKNGVDVAAKYMKVRGVPEKVALRVLAKKERRAL
jgi:hypothetical protein